MQCCILKTQFYTILAAVWPDFAWEKDEQT